MGAFMLVYSRREPVVKRDEFVRVGVDVSECVCVCVCVCCDASVGAHLMSRACAR